MLHSVGPDSTLMALISLLYWFPSGARRFGNRPVLFLNSWRLKCLSCLRAYEVLLNRPLFVPNQRRHITSAIWITQEALELVAFGNKHHSLRSSLGNTCFLETWNKTQSPAAVPLLIWGWKLMKALLASQRKAFKSMLTCYHNNEYGWKEQFLSLSISKAAEKVMLKQFNLWK